jgi:hypothetical protein
MGASTAFMCVLFASVAATPAWAAARLGATSNHGQITILGYSFPINSKVQIVITEQIDGHFADPHVSYVTTRAETLGNFELTEQMWDPCTDTHYSGIISVRAYKVAIPPVPIATTQVKDRCLPPPLRPH